MKVSFWQQVFTPIVSRGLSLLRGAGLKTNGFDIIEVNLVKTEDNDNALTTTYI